MSSRFLNRIRNVAASNSRCTPSSTHQTKIQKTKKKPAHKLQKLETLGAIHVLNPFSTLTLSPYDLPSLKRACGVRTTPSSPPVSYIDTTKSHCFTAPCFGFRV